MATMYNTKRKQAGLTRYEVAWSLDIPFNDYVEIERGNASMNNGQLEKFLTMVNNEEIINTIHKNYKDKVRMVREKIKTGELGEILAKTGVSRGVLGVMLKLSHSALYYAFSDPDDEKTMSSDETRCVVFDKVLELAKKNRKKILEQKIENKKENTQNIEIIKKAETGTEIPEVEKEVKTEIIEETNTSENDNSLQASNDILRNAIKELQAENTFLKKTIETYNILIKKLNLEV